MAGELIDSLNLLTKENNKQISDMDNSKSLGVAGENENIIKNIRDKFKLVIIGDSIVRFIDAPKYTSQIQISNNRWFNCTVYRRNKIYVTNSN